MTRLERRHKDEELVRGYFKAEEIANNCPADTLERRHEYERNEIETMREKE